MVSLAAAVRAPLPTDAVAPPAPGTPGLYYASATRHILAGKFLRFWQTHNGGLIFGPPISEPLREQNGDGTVRVYLVQYFQHGRLDYHPELSGTSYEISIGQVGRQALQQRGWL